MDPPSNPGTGHNAMDTEKSARRNPAGIAARPMRLAAVAIAAAAMACGCMTHGPRFPVSSSQLNWLEIAYRPAAQGANPVRISLLGTGAITMRTGSSPQIMNTFSVDTRSSSWNDIEEIRADIPQDEMQAIFQQFIDTGITDSPRSDKNAGKNPGKPFAMFGGRIDREKIRRKTDDPALMKMVERLAKWMIDQENAR